MNGRFATVTSATAVEGFNGIYLIGITVPEGLAAGRAEFVVRSGDTTSNAVRIPVR